MSDQLDLAVGGMTCSSCAMRIEKKLNKLDGVTATVNYATETASITFDRHLITPEMLVATVEATGYTAELPRVDSEDEQEADDEFDALRKRLWMSVVLSVPVIIVSMVPAWQFDYWQWVAFALATPVVTVGAWPFHRAALVNARHFATTMDTLISVGVTAAYLWSVWAIFFGGAGSVDMAMDMTLPGDARTAGAAHIYFEVAAGVTMLILTGRYFEHRAKRRSGAALMALLALGAKDAAVLRDGQRQSVDGASLVPGDIVLLEAGDKVPADLRLIEARGLAAQEAILTGESVAVEKTPDPVAAAAPLGDRRSMLWSGTLVTQGTARGLVAATGSSTEIGRIGGLLAGVEQLTTPLVAQMDHFARWLSFLILLASALLLAWGHFVGHEPFPDLFMTVVAIAVSAIPEGLPAVMTITLAIGVQAMARRNAIVRHLPAIEAIGSVSVICTDKTGTLTRNEMVVVTAETAEGVFQVSGEGYAPEGRIDPPGDLRPLARAAALCNDAALVEKGGQWLIEGDPMEGALLVFAGKIMQDTPRARLDAIPFDSRHRFMAVLTDGPKGRITHVKGAPERVLRMCAGLDLQAWHDRAEAMARRGLRVLALAERAETTGLIDAPALEGGLSFLGLVGLIDPPRPEAIAAVAECRAAGIRVKMITGDHAGTAAAIAAQIGLVNHARVLTGADLDKLDDAQLALEVAGVDVFARSSPED